MLRSVLGLFSTDAVFWIVVGIPLAIGLIALGAVLIRPKGDGGSSSSESPPASPSSTSSSSTASP
jgi:hypothetical protein